MYYITLITIVYLSFGLIKDYKSDEGQNMKAKILHAICLLLIIGNYFSAFYSLGNLLRNFEKAKEKFSVDVGFVSGQLHFIIFLSHSVLAIAVVISAIQMIKRNDSSRKILILLLPLLAILEVFSFYRGWLQGSGDFESNHSMILLLGILIVGIPTAIIVAIYKSQNMITFFSETEENHSITNEENLEHQQN